VTSPDHPAPDELADDRDEDGWDRARHGTFADYATADDAVTTVPAEEYLAGTGDHTGGE
jgi:hypothetical protein